MGTPAIAQNSPGASGSDKTQGGQPDKADDKEADKDWQTLSDTLRGHNTTPENESNATDAAKRQAAVGRADLAKSFYTKHPGDPRAVEARKAEIFALLDSDAGNDSGGTAGSVTARARATVQAFRSDTKVAAKERSVVAGFADFHEAGKGARSREGMRAAMADAARGLMREFPDQPQGYTSLLTLAGGSEEKDARALARDLAASGAPDAIKQRARRLVARLDLKGTKLSDALTLSGDETQTGKSSKPIVLYVWATWSPYSLTIAQMLGQRHLDAARWIGLNLDKPADQAAARQAAQGGGFPGRQIYDVLGADGVSAGNLAADTAPLVYFVDDHGRIQDVQGLTDLEQKLGELGL